ncbi:MAG: GGDEF domain-containing protein [Gammaproteobacteria bacterium]|nr:GGDEF domain-containing protein [Gammaproteobacteria bacterium]
MNTSSEVEIKKIYEKSIRLLNDKQARLMDMRQVLKKAVIRLSLTARKDDDRVNEILNDIKSCVADDVNIDLLGQHLDNLFVLTNNSDYQNSAKSEPFSIVLKKGINRYVNTPDSEEFISKLKILVNKEMSDVEMSVQIIKFVDDMSHKKQQDQDDLNLFVKKLSTDNNFTYNVSGSSINLKELAIELSKYIHSLQVCEIDNIVSEEKNTKKSDNVVIINHVLNEIINQLTLPSVSKKEQGQIRKLLNKPENTDENVKEVSSKIVILINQSIQAYEEDKNELEKFISKICEQLSDIEEFAQLIRTDNSEAKARTLALTDCVETGMSGIEDTVTKSSDLEKLKKDVAINLKEIRKHVEEYKITDKENTGVSSQRYTQVLEDLTRAQDESTKLKEQLHESKTLLLRDPLTGIANRLAYSERVTVEFNRWQRSKSPLCLAIWDIDHFKQINDTYGHSVGDRVLILFSDIIQKRIRKVDFFARIGGEEFVLLMPDTSLADALIVNNKLRCLLEECNFHYEGKDCRITSSVGIAQFVNGDDEDVVLKNADTAMYQSKKGGRNMCTTFDSEIDNNVT